MKDLEISGKTVEEAIQHALEELNVSREEVEITVLNEGKHGILGLGGEEATIRVASLTPKEEDGAEIAQNVLETLLDKMGLITSVALQAEPLLNLEKEDKAPITFNITGDDLGVLIGRRGQTLSCLQYIVRLIVAQQTKTWLLIMIDVEGYRQRRYSALQALAQRMAEQVKTSEMPFTLEPMSAFERRIIHITLADDPDVTTQSTGEGQARKVVILPKGAAEA